MNSWIAAGTANLPITADQVRSVLGNEHVTSLATKLGIDPAQQRFDPSISLAAEACADSSLPRMEV